MRKVRKLQKVMPQSCFNGMMPEELFPSRAFEHGWDPLDEEKCPEGNLHCLRRYDEFAD